MGWHTNPLMLLHERQFFYGTKYILPVPVGELLPFQFIRTTGGLRPITAFDIIHEDGTSTDVLSDVASMIDYKSTDVSVVIRFKATRVLSGTWDEGWKRATVSDGVTTWQSDYFLWTRTPLVKIEWWHPINIPVENGVIDYSDNFKYHVYLRTDIGMPQYPLEEEVDRRESIDFPFRETSYKQYQFPTIVSEYLMDCLRLIPIHAEIRIHHLDDVLRVTKMRHSEVRWIEIGDVASTLWTFRTNTVVSTYAQSAGEEVVTRSCYPVNYTAERFILDQFGALSVPSELSNVLNEPGYVLYSSGSVTSTRLFFVPANDNAPYEEFVDQGDIMFDRQTGKYYLSSTFEGGSIAPIGITSIGNAPAYTIEALILADTFIRIEYRPQGGQWTTLSTIPSSSWLGGYDLGALAPSYYEVRLVFQSDSCGDFFTTDGFVVGASGEGETPLGVSFDMIGQDIMVY